MPAKHALDRSTMFTCLINLSAKYGRLDTRAGEAVTTAALAAWYDSTAVDMYAFCREWIIQNRKDLLPLK